MHADKTYLWLILILSIPANSMSSIRNLRRSIQQICSIYHTCLLAFFKLTSVLCLGSPNAGVVCTVITKTSFGIRRYHGKKIRCASLGSRNWPYIPLSHQENQQRNLEKGVKLLRWSLITLSTSSLARLSRLYHSPQCCPPCLKEENFYLNYSFQINSPVTSLSLW